MCGIVGGLAVTQKNMERALAVIRHRGPDAEGILFSQDKDIAFGHRRLAIIDLDSRADQPMVCSRTGNIIIFNGEIYNFRAVREELAEFGWTFRTSSDTEVLLAAYAQWGTECLNRLNGMFAFAIHDAKSRRVFLARDRVGKKPLYYSLCNGGFVFASELKALLAVRPELPRDMDYSALREYMILGYIPGELSIYKHIRKLKPAHHATYDLKSGAFNEKRYWTLPPPGGDEIREDESAEELEYLLKDAIRIRLESDVPVGAFLSGGLDSSLVVAMMAREKPDLVAYTAKFPISRYDESPVARKVADWAGIQHKVITIDTSDGAILKNLSLQFDEPFADSSLLPTYLVSQAIHKYVKVALSGDGGDELFAGYGYYSLIKDEEKWDNLPCSIRKLFSYLHGLLPVGVYGKNFLRRLPYSAIERFLQITGIPEYVGVSPLYDKLDRRLHDLPADGYRRSILKSFSEQYVSVDSMTSLQKMTRLDFQSYLPDDILVKVDRASMFASLEMRAPLLDYRIVEFAYRLPDNFRLRGKTKKYLLKKIARKYLPPDFPFENKRGFSIPEAEWFRGEWRKLIEEVSNTQSSLIDASRTASLQKAHDAKGRYGKLLFKIFMLAQFEQNYGVSL